MLATAACRLLRRSSSCRVVIYGRTNHFCKSFSAHPESGGANKALLDNTPEAQSRKWTAELKQLLSSSHPTAAWRLFDRLLESRQADAYQLNTMLSHGGGASDEMQALIERAEAACVATSAATFNAWLQQLQHEGRPVEPALAVMRAHGVAQDGRTRAVLDLSAESLSSSRVTDLRMLLDLGDRTAAWRLFNGLLETQQADMAQLRCMLTCAGLSQGAMLILVQRAEAAGVEIDEPTRSSCRRAIREIRRQWQD